MKLSFITLDVFTNIRYTGNPLAVVTVPANQRLSLTKQQKQHVASEFNLSETVFLHEPLADASEVEIDIFTSLAEVSFAGHPTVGTASLILHHLRNDDIKSILTKAGPIAITRNVGSVAVSAEIPHDVHIHARTYVHPLVPNTRFPLVSIVKGMSFIHVELPDLNTLGKIDGGIKTVKEAYSSTTELDEGWQTGLILTHFYKNIGSNVHGRQFIRARMFGSREDPATGSAACALSAYLSLTAKDDIEKGQRKFTYYFNQGVEMGRWSEIEVDVVLNEAGNEISSVVLSGTAVKVMEGTLEI